MRNEISYSLYENEILIYYLLHKNNYLLHTTQGMVCNWLYAGQGRDSQMVFTGYRNALKAELLARGKVSGVASIQTYSAAA